MDEIRTSGGRFVSGRGRFGKGACNVFTAREGRIQRAIRRAFITNNGQPLCMGDLLTRCYPATSDHPHWHRTNIRDALPKHAVRVGRSRAHGWPIVWGPNAGLRRLIEAECVRHDATRERKASENQASES